MTMSALMLNEEELRANVPSNVFQQHKEMERVCGKSGKVELLIVAASFLIFCMGRQALECRRCRPADFVTRKDSSCSSRISSLMSQTKVLTQRFKKLALALCPTFLNPATPANSTEVSTTPLGPRRDLFLGDNLDLGLEATRATI